MITKEFLETEISELERESEKARVFLIRAEAAINVHRMLLKKLETPDGDLPAA